MLTPLEEFINTAKVLKDSDLQHEELIERLILVAPGNSRTEKCLTITRVLRAINANPDIVPDVTHVTPPSPLLKKVPGSCVEDPEWLEGRVERVIISDLHIPRHRMDLLLHIAEKHEGADLVINGDIMNHDKNSKWAKQFRDRCRYPEWMMSTVRIYDQAIADLSLITPRFRRVTLLRGNHDDWFAKSTADAMGGDASTGDDYYERRFAELPNIVIPKKTVRDYYLRKFGDIWAGHFKCHGKPTNKGANNAIEYILSNYELNSMGEWNILVQAHTHRLSQGEHLGKTGIECGALTQIADYQDNQPGKGSPPQLGYYVAVQYDGITNLEESGLVPFNKKYTVEHKPIEGFRGPVYENFM